MFKTEDGDLIEAEKSRWDNLRDGLKTVNPYLVEVVDNLSPGKDLPIYVARYKFGDDIIKDSQAYLPLKNGRLISFNSNKLPKQLVKDLSYDSVNDGPLGVLVNKNCEYYMQIGERNISHLLISAGEIFGGVSRILNKALAVNTLNAPAGMWDLSSGSRSTFIMPKVSEGGGISRLQKELNISLDKPTGYHDQHPFITQICRKIDDIWYCEVYWFANSWKTNMKDSVWFEFIGCLFQANRSLNRYWHNTPKWTAIFNHIEKTTRISHISPYVLATARHLIAMAAGCASGFSPALNNKSAPVHALHKALLEIYRLKEHWPIIMTASQLKDNVYYSANYPTLSENDPSTFKGESIIALIDEVQGVMKKYCPNILNHPSIKIQAPLLYDTVASTDFSYYHPDPGMHNTVKNSALLENEDHRFVCNHLPDTTFPAYSAFLKGCVKITKK